MNLDLDVLDEDKLEAFINLLNTIPRLNITTKTYQLRGATGNELISLGVRTVRDYAPEEMKSSLVTKIKEIFV